MVSTTHADIHESSFKCYPNPTNEKVIIDLNNTDFLLIESQLLDIRGVVLRENFIVTDMTELDIQDLPEGVYFLRLNFNEDSETQKIIKQ